MSLICLFPAAVCLALFTGRGNTTTSLPTDLSDTRSNIGALKVDRYINGGNGTAEEVVAEIGFVIYRTQEMADLVAWMRAYNEAVTLSTILSKRK